MSEKDNIQVIQQMYGCFGKGDLEGLVAGCAPDITWTLVGPASIPYGGTRKGHAGVRDFFGKLMGSVRITAFAPADFIAQNDTVVVLGSQAGTALKSGKSVATDWVHVFTLKNGKVTQFREFLDSAAIAAAHG